MIRERLNRRAEGGWLLLGALGLLIAASAGEAGGGARAFRPPAIDPVGPFAPLVRAAGLQWDPAILRSASVLAGLLVALAAVWLAARSPRPPRAWLLGLLTAVVLALMLFPGVALQAGLRQSSAPWFHTNDSTFQIELGGELLRAGANPYGADYRFSGMERFYSRDGTADTALRNGQVALRHFAYFPGTPLTGAAWGLLPEPWSDYRFLALICTLAGAAAALLFQGPLGWRLALGALIAANPIAIKSAWFGQADAPALLCVLLAFALITRSRLVWAAVLLAVAILLKQFALFAVPFLALAIWKAGDRDSRLRSALAFGGVLFVGFLPFVIMDIGALYTDTVEYGRSIYPIIGYGLGPLLLKAGLISDRTGDYALFLPLALLVWLPATLVLLRAQARSPWLWVAAAGFATSLYVLFFISRVFQETYLAWPLTAIALAGLLAIDQRAREPAAANG